MATTTWQTAFEEILKPLGHHKFNTTTNIAANQLVVSTDAAKRFPRDDTFNGWYMLIRGAAAANDEEIRVVENYVAASGTFTVDGPALASESGIKRFDLLRFNPDDVKAAYNRARQDIFPSVGILRDFWFLAREQQHLYTMPAEIQQVRRVATASLISPTRADNLLLNPSFDDWTNSTTVDNWTVSAAGNVSQEKATTTPTNEVVLYQNSVLIKKTVSSLALTMLQTLSSLTIGIEDVAISFSAWVYASAGKVQATLVGSPDTIRSSPVDGELNQHDGWSRITVDGQTSRGADSWKAGIRIPGVTADDLLSIYVGVAYNTIGGDLAGHEPDWTPINNYDEIVMPTSSQASSGDTPVTPVGNKQILLPSALARASIVRVTGVDTLESVSADSDTISADTGTLAVIYAKTREYIAEQKADEPTSGNNVKWKRLQSEFHTKFNDALGEGKGSELPVKAPSAPDLW